jgi:hypothetical protein
VAVRILAEVGAAAPWTLPGNAALESIRCETEQPVDDLLVSTDQAGSVFGQVKRTLTLSASGNSDLASAIDQFVRQFISCRDAAGSQPRERRLDHRDRLLLITGPDSSAGVRTDLRLVLDQIRALVSSQTLDYAAVNAPQRRARDIAVRHVRQSWQALGVSAPSDDEIRELLSLIHVQTLDVGDGGTDEREALQLLKATVLRDPGRADDAWNTLIVFCGQLAATRTGADRPRLQRMLLDAGLELRAAPSYRADIEQLRASSLSTLEALAKLAEMRLGTVILKIQRVSTAALRTAAEVASLLVVGEPGAGKSAALHDLVRGLLNDDHDVVLLAADRIAARSSGELRQELGLRHEVATVLGNWPGTRPGWLVVDALDAARYEPAALRELIRTVVQLQGRWRVVASIRKFDLRYSRALQQLFAGAPTSEYRDVEFGAVRHLNVPLLSDEEFAQLLPQSPQLSEVIDSSPTPFRELLRVPFNLRLVAELLGAGVAAKQLEPLQTQLELLDEYWHYRVLVAGSAAESDAREAVLRQASEAMIAARALRVERSRVAATVRSGALHEMLSGQVLVEWQPSPTAPPERYVLAFAHNVLFDYAVARLLLRGDPAALVQRLAESPDLVLVIRPSLVLHFRHLWALEPSRETFWRVTFEMAQAHRIPEVAKVVGPAVAAELAYGLVDLEPLLLALEGTAGATQSQADEVLRHLVGTIIS